MLIARMKPSPVSPACPAAFARRERLERLAGHWHQSLRAVRHNGWRATIYDAPVESGEKRIGHAFAAISRHFAARDRAPARAVPSPGREARSSQGGSNRSETNSRLPCARSFPSHAAASCGFSRSFPRRPPGGADPACCRMPSNLLTSNRDPTPAHPPAYRSPVQRSSRITKQLGADCSEPL